MIAWLQRAWRWILMVIVGLVCAIIPGVAWWRARRRVRVLEQASEIQQHYLHLAAEAVQAREAALTDLGHRLDAMRAESVIADIADEATRRELDEMEPADAWDRAFGRDGGDE